MYLLFGLRMREGMVALATEQMQHHPLTTRAYLLGRTLLLGLIPGLVDGSHGAFPRLIPGGRQTPPNRNEGGFETLVDHQELSPDLGDETEEEVVHATDYRQQPAHTANSVDQSTEEHIDHREDHCGSESSSHSKGRDGVPVVLAMVREDLDTDENTNCQACLLYTSRCV